MNKFCILRDTFWFPQFNSFSLYMSVVSSLWSLSEFGRGVGRMEGGRLLKKRGATGNGMGDLVEYTLPA